MLYDAVPALILPEPLRRLLPGGVQLRYDPADGWVRSLPYPGMPSQWREASAYHAA